MEKWLTSKEIRDLMNLTSQHLYALVKSGKILTKQITGGLFESSCGKILNADINGAIGIMRKQNVISDVQLMNLRDRGDVVAPLMFPLKRNS